MNDYFENSDIIYARKAKLDTSKMSKYVKSPLVEGYVKPQDLVPSGNMAIVRTLSGDNNLEIRDNTILIIGIKGNVTAITEEKFKSTYIKTGKKFTLNLDYTPTIKDADNGKTYSLMKNVSGCISTGDMKIYAKKLTKTTKLFPYWDSENYMIGRSGDYLCVSVDDPNNLFIIEKSIFKKTYSAI